MILLKFLPINVIWKKCFMLYFVLPILFVDYSNVSFDGIITTVGKERADFLSVWRGFLFL